METKITVDRHEASKEVLILISGILNQDIEIPIILDCQKLTVDFLNLTHINSNGISKWCSWIRLHKGVQAVYLENCPYIFVRSFSMIIGMIGGNTVVKSFFVPYFSSPTGERKNVLFTFGVHFDSNGLKKMPYILDDKGNTMELDVLKDKYFSFLKK